VSAADHFGTGPTALAAAIVTELEVLRKVGASGCLRTLKRFAGDKYDLDAIDLQLHGGAPAMLVAYLGGTFEGDSTTQQRFRQRMRFSIICCAGSYESIAARLSGGASLLTEPGVEDLADLATYYGVRALALSGGERRAGITLAIPTEHKWLRVEPEKYAMAVELEATRRFDAYSDQPEAEFTTLGLVHSPLGPDDTPATPGALFEEDTTTPKQTPPEVGGGVTEL
jgi:hypothetical protein